MAKPDPVAAALAQAEKEAQEAAANQSGSTSTAVGQAAGTSGAAAAAQPGSRRSLADLAESAAFAVDAYTKIDQLGIYFGKDKARFDELEVSLKFADMKGGWIIRANSAGSAKYATSYDGSTEAKSRRGWEAVIAEFQRVDPNAYVSDLAELPVTLTKAVTLKDGKELKVGTRLGVSISYQNYKFFSSWFAEQYKKYGPDAVLKVRMGAQDKSNPGGAQYGVYTWEVLDEAA